jgi:hypothetical protein
MNTQEMVDRTRQALEEFRCLPAEEQFRQMQEWGTLDEAGKVRLGSEQEDEQNEEE